MTLPATFEITLDFLSDWHVGTGQGRLGTVDAEVRRDADRLPVVPAKTLVGVWRDACETVAATFDQAADRPHAWQEWVTWLFGSQAARPGDGTAAAGRAPVPAALRLTPAHAPAWLRRGVRNRPALAQAAVVLRPGVSIDDETGTAADRLLRVEERAIRGLRLTSQVSLAMAGAVGGVAADDPTGEAGTLPAPAELLLRAGARLVEGVGGKRNRGSGRVAVLLPGARVDDADLHPVVTDPRLAELLAAGVPATPPPPPAPAEAVEIFSYGRLHANRRAVRVVLRVVTPVVAAHDVLGNVIFSRDAIPGTAMLGAMMRRAEQVTGEGVRRGPVGLGEVSVGDAVPAVGDAGDAASVVPARPVPTVWQRGDKGRGTTVRNTLRAEPARGERAKAMSGWIAADGDRWRHVEVAMEVSTHAVVDDEARRPTVASGGVYTYLGITPGTLLCSDVVLPAGVRLRLDRGERLRFGRSRKDDFGLVEVVDVIDPLPAPPAPSPVEGTLRVWCVSDVLLRDERLAPDPSPHALARALSTMLAEAAVTVREAETVSAATRREGFGVAWGRPRPSQVALRAGSVVTLTVTGLIHADRLAEIERDGIGERTAEGYGRVRFNSPELAAEQPAVDFFPASPMSGTSADPTPGPVDQLEGEAEPHPVEINAWRRAVRQASAGLAPHELVPGIDRLAGNRAQLGSLRAQLERLTMPGGREMVRNWLEGTSAVRARREMWTKDVLADLAALLLDDPDRVWKQLGLAGPQPLLVLAPGREDVIRQRLHAEALTTVLGDALRRLSRTPGGGSRASSTAGSDTDTSTTTPKEAR
ncbi:MULTISPECIES: RAMP superfamily CRISPR-associated protein [unclassified Micromonospora]|uniref:RAMP superfamily CRISPR-associated protein n=1 Tax=unclassified Micromonospora TaxID=2617518 RepID=UPI00363C30D8